jgi:hypothetical protein
MPGIDPRRIEVSLVVEDWRALDRALAEEHAGALVSSPAPTKKA